MSFGLVCRRSNTTCWTLRSHVTSTHRTIFSIVRPRRNRFLSLSNRAAVRTNVFSTPYSFRAFATANTTKEPDHSENENISQDSANSKSRKKNKSAWTPWAQLVKFELSAMVVVTSGGGYVLSGGSLFDFETLLGLLVGTSMCAASAATFNQIIEIKWDSMMTRTRKRPLVTGVISKVQAQAFGAAMGGGGAAILYVTTNEITSFLGLFTIILYTMVYTPLKRSTRFNTEVGAIVGAIPPVMGWTAAFGCSKLMSIETVFLAGTLFAWQMHHFMTIAWNNRHQYARAGYVMQSLGDEGGYSTASKGLAWCGLMAGIPVATTLCGITVPMFIVSGTMVNGPMFWSYYRFYKHRTDPNAFKARIHGFLQLVAFLVLMVFHLKERDNITAFVQLDSIRQAGYAMCVHKVMLGKDTMCLWIQGEKAEQAIQDIEKNIENGVNKGIENLLAESEVASNEK